MQPSGMREKGRRPWRWMCCQSSFSAGTSPLQIANGTPWQDMLEALDLITDMCEDVFASHGRRIARILAKTGDLQPLDEGCRRGTDDSPCQGARGRRRRQQRGFLHRQSHSEFGPLDPPPRKEARGLGWVMPLKRSMADALHRFSRLWGLTLSVDCRNWHFPDFNAVLREPWRRMVGKMVGLSFAETVLNRTV